MGLPISCLAQLKNLNSKVDKHVKLENICTSYPTNMVTDALAKVARLLHPIEECGEMIRPLYKGCVLEIFN